MCKGEVIVMAGAEQKMQTTAWEKMEILMTENAVTVDSTATFWGDEFAKQLKEVKYSFTEMKVDIWKKKYKLDGSKKTSHKIVKDEGTDVATEEANSIISEKELQPVLEVSNSEKYYWCPGCKMKCSKLSTLEFVKCACGACIYGCRILSFHTWCEITQICNFAHVKILSFRAWHEKHKYVTLRISKINKICTQNNTIMSC